MEPVTILVVSAVVGALANLGSKLLTKLVREKKSHEIEVILSDGSKEILPVDTRAPSEEIEKELRKILDKGKGSANTENTTPNAL